MARRAGMVKPTHNAIPPFVPWIWIRQAWRPSATNPANPGRRAA